MNFKTTTIGIFLSLSFLLPIQPARAQSPDQIPAFRMLMSDGSFFTSADLQKNKPVVLIYFSPDCEHCQALMNEFFKNIDTFSEVQVVLVTFRPLAELFAFERTYQTYKYKNVKAGTEGNSFYLRKFFRLDSTPFTALYNKDGILVYSYRKDTPLDDLVKRVKQL